MKKQIIVFVLLLSLFLAGCGADTDPRIEALEEQVAILQNRMDLLQEQLDGIELPGTAQAEPEEYEPAASMLVLAVDFDEKTITIREGIAHVFLVPEGIQGAKAVLYHNGTVINDWELEMYPGEGSGSYETEIGNLVFERPTLTEGDQLELVLEVVLPDGTLLTAEGCAFGYADGQLFTIAG